MGVVTFTQAKVDEFCQRIGDAIKEAIDDERKEVNKKITAGDNNFEKYHDVLLDRLAGMDAKINRLEGRITELSESARRSDFKNRLKGRR